MNNKLKLAVAAALFAGASSANAGITIPAGDWTLDIGGVVNAYYTSTSFSGDDRAGEATTAGAGEFGDGQTVNNITTGLLPNYLSVSGKTRQNDLDVAFTISINPGASTKNAGVQSANQENRQAFLTFGDASWGSIKVGKDLGIYASDAILNDMTLLGVGSAAGSLAGNTTTLGRIGRGFMYADWKSQVAYTSPNFNGFSFTVGATQGWNALNGLNTTNATTGAVTVNGVGSTERSGSSPAFEGKASYAWTGDVAGKVWASFISQKVDGLTNATAAGQNSVTGVIAAASANTLTDTSDRATAYDMGATINLAGFGLTGYYGNGDGIGQTVQLLNGFDANGKSRDSDQWYVQATYALPTATKLGVSYGESTLDGNSVDGFRDIQSDMLTVGAYHPITKHLNLVAEYSVAEDSVNSRTAGADTDVKAKTISLGAILFF
jgi:predicted porin